jgi:hypothetical protein
MLKKLLLILFPIVLFVFYITKDIAIPYVGPNATNFTVYSLIAHNFNKFGYLQTKLTPLISVSSDYPKNPSYFFHHPTLLSFSQSLLFKIFGEEFWVGRLTVILYSLGSLFLVYLIGKKLLDKKYALLSLLTFSIIPASTLFGKMIGQEPLVLFFCLLALTFSLDFLKTNKNIYFIFTIFSLILGICSDWPAVIFSLSLFLIYKHSKKTKQGIYLILASLITLGVFLIYIYIFNNGFADLRSALLARGFTGLLSIKFWPILWITALISRIFIYFNPLIVIGSLFFIWEMYKLKFKKIKRQNIVILSLLIFGVLHLCLYMQASFSHLYLIYYLLPFITFAFSLFIYKLLKTRKRLVLLIFIFSLIYLSIISNIKNLQNRENIWRYDLAKTVAKYIPKYETFGYCVLQRSPGFVHVSYREIKRLLGYYSQARDYAFRSIGRGGTSAVIRAPSDGVLFSSSQNCGSSSIIKIKYIDHGDGVMSFYLHVQ